MQDIFKAWGDCAIQKDAAGKVISEVATLDCIPIIFSNLLTALLIFSGIIALLMFVMGGFKFMNSAGDAKKLDGAKNNFKFGLFGLAIVLFSFLMINIISVFTGVECIKSFGFGCDKIASPSPK